MCCQRVTVWLGHKRAAAQYDPGSGKVLSSDRGAADDVFDLLDLLLRHLLPPADGDSRIAGQRVIGAAFAGGGAFEKPCRAVRPVQAQFGKE